MTKLAFIKFLIFFFFITAAYGQKVKYKDIWNLLNTKQYEAAEPFLKKYLKETTDNPNAYLYMGMIFQEKAQKDDMLKQTKRTIAEMDSAILFYDKAYKSITDKEVKRNSDLYQAYNRRDLRTGEFGVKLSDIQFDLEKKIEGLRERIDRVKMVKYYFSLADSLYQRSNTLYKSLQAKYPGEKELYLRGDETSLKSLGVLANRFDSVTKAFENYKSSVATVGKMGYNQNITLRDIGDFKADGTSLASFYNDDLQLWDYSKFAARTRQVIQKDIMPTREHLVTYDIEINKLREKLNKESVSVKNDLTSLVDKLLTEQLKKYDKAPLPMEIFTLKIADLEYRSTVIENKHRPDSTDVHARLAMLNKELKYLSKVDSMATRLSGADIDSRTLDYEHFVKNTFNSGAVLKSFVKSLEDFAVREKKSKQQELANRQESLRWIINGKDSIPLFQDERSTFRSLVTVDEKYTAGLFYTDSLSPAGYLFTINASRIPDIKITFPVEKTSFKKSRLTNSKAVTFADTSGQLYFVLIFSDHGNKDSKYAATLAKIYRSDGLAWSSNYQLGFIPKEITFKPDTGEVTMRGEDDQHSVVDKNGKLLK